MLGHVVEWCAVSVLSPAIHHLIFLCAKMGGMACPMVQCCTESVLFPAIHPLVCLCVTMGGMVGPWWSIVLCLCYLLLFIPWCVYVLQCGGGDGGEGSSP